MDTPDLLILGLDPQGLEIGLAVATLGGQVIVARSAESALAQAVRDGELLARLGSVTDATAFALRRAAVVEDIRRQRSDERLRAARIRVTQEPVRFVDHRRVAIGETILRPRRILLASGVEPNSPLAGLNALFEHGTVPPRLVLDGSTVMALDLASLLTRLGTEVTLVSDGPLVPECDPDGLRLLLDRLRRQGLVVANAMPARGDADIPVWTLGEPRPALDGFDLAKLGVQLRGGFQTSRSHVFAIGRLADPGALPDPGAVAHLVGRMFFRRSARYAPRPRLRLAGGQSGLAEIGLTEAQALARGKVQVARAAFAPGDPADFSGGFVKLLADRRGRLLGASLCGPGAAEAAAILSLALAQGLGLADLARQPGAPGTVSEAIAVAAASPARRILRASSVQRAFRLFRILG